MNSEIRNEEEVLIRFRIFGERTLEIPKRDWEVKWKDKVNNFETGSSRLRNLVYEIERQNKNCRFHDDEWFEFECCDPA